MIEVDLMDCEFRQPPAVRESGAKPEVMLFTGESEPETGEEYLQFELDGKTLKELDGLARASGCSRFEMCVRLLEESVSDVSVVSVV